MMKKIFDRLAGKNIELCVVFVPDGLYKFHNDIDNTVWTYYIKDDGNGGFEGEMLRYIKI